MDLPIEVINAVKPKPKARKPYVKQLTKRILHAIGGGLRTTTSIANALGVDKAKIQSNLHHIKAKGLAYSVKQEGKLEHKYHLATDKPVLDAYTSDKPKKKAVKARKPYTKRKSTYNEAGVNTTNSFNTPPNEGNTKTYNEAIRKFNELTTKIGYLEQSLVEKEKEVWTLECEVFDKKAIIKYLEEKLFALGVRV